MTERNRSRAPCRTAMTGVLLVLLAFAAGCRQQLFGTDNETATITSLAISPATATLAPGSNLQFSVAARDSSGVPYPVSAGALSWYATGGNITSDGLYTAGSQTGQYNVTAQASSSLADTAEILITSSTSIISDLLPSNYTTTILQQGAPIYVDRTFAAASIPAEFQGWLLIRTANDDKAVTASDAISFNLASATTVAIAYDKRATALPAWLSQWQATGETLGTSDGDASPMPIRTKVLGPGPVTLGGNLSDGAAGAQSMYVLFVDASTTNNSDAPYPPSPVISGIGWDFDNLVRRAPGSDLWPVAWGPDDNIYTSWGDGGGFGGTNSDGRVSLGFARIEGPPQSLVGVNVWGGKNGENPATFGGKGVGLISIDGVLYAWINEENASPPDLTLAWSADLAGTWQKVDWKFPGSSGNFFPNTFLSFRRDNSGSRDDFVYFYGREWDDYTSAYLGRVRKESILTQSSYEYFAGLDGANTPTWTSDITQREPVFSDSRGVGGTSVVYNPGLDRYILTTAHGAVGKLGVFDAPEPWGPWTTVAYYDNWGGFGSSLSLYYHYPAKWISSDGTTMWLVFSSTGELDSFNLVRSTLTLTAP